MSPIDLDFSNEGGDWIKGRALAFTLTGSTRVPTGHSRQATLTWRGDGTLSGDAQLALEAERRVAAREWVKATPTGPVCEAAMRPREAAAILLASLFEWFATTGDFPGELLDHGGGVS